MNSSQVHGGDELFCDVGLCRHKHLVLTSFVTGVFVSDAAEMDQMDHDARRKLKRCWR